MQYILNHFYLILAICFGVVSQLIIKWKMSAFSFDDYETWQDKFILAFSMLLNPYIIIALILTLLAGVTWMIAMTKFEISYAYPFTLLGLVLVTIFSVVFFGESISVYKIGGIALIILGVVVISKGM
ncbi:EamA family transporter [bacterium]|jgi:multidrug transporter EmrE-like cation transporter|nr:EamA family transporter [bacterium]